MLGDGDERLNPPGELIPDSEVFDNNKDANWQKKGI